MASEFLGIWNTHVPCECSEEAIASVAGTFRPKIRSDQWLLFFSRCCCFLLSNLNPLHLFEVPAFDRLKPGCLYGPFQFWSFDLTIWLNLTIIWWFCFLQMQEQDTGQARNDTWTRFPGISSQSGWPNFQIGSLWTASTPWPFVAAKKKVCPSWAEMFTLWNREITILYVEGKPSSLRSLYTWVFHQGLVWSYISLRFTILIYTSGGTGASQRKL